MITFVTITNPMPIREHEHASDGEGYEYDEENNIKYK